ncbi:protein indeterminate-domain 16-like [Impatiens glandulifera]|uniref:protein indeterminate-domain 16-like n=1 Tax=Impatiens glandulifera TaxID=253017 RepID=UPI001FB05B86|nr:protein indeterminate-domain 16-like [Impatiens glandulifera]
MDEDQRELQFFHPSGAVAAYHRRPTNNSSSSNSPKIPPWQHSDPPPIKFRSQPNSQSDPFDVGPSLDLQLSISVRPKRPPRPVSGGPNRVDQFSVEALRWQTAEQIRLAAAEKAYAERVRELTRREMEMAQSEFARAKRVWERAREEVERAELMKERATRRVDSACMEITCHSCRQKFRPIN